MSNLNKENFSAEEEGLFKDLAFRAAMNNGGNIPKDVANNITTLKSVIKNIPTTAGRKYALSKLLNDSKFGFDKDFYINDSKYADSWSIKNQEDYKAPDVVKAEEKRDKEEFFDWDSPNHWSKKSTKDLERRARDAGYADRGSYMKAVGDAQVQKDREKLLDDVPGYIARFAYPRATEAVMRGDDIQPKDIGLDLTEQVLYTVNPGGRIAQATKLGEKAGVLGKIGAVAADIASNPIILETADDIAYDDPNNARSEFNPADVAIGAGINAGMNKVVDSRIAKQLFGELVAPKPVPKQFQTEVSQKARNAVAAEKAKATRDTKTVVSDMLDAIGKGEDISQYVAKLRELKMISDKPNPTREFRDRTIKDYMPQVKNAIKYETVPLVSNKAGDLISEDPKMTRSLVSRVVRTPGLNLAGPLIDAYYESKEAESEKDKLNKMLDSLK